MKKKFKVSLITVVRSEEFYLVTQMHSHCVDGSGGHHMAAKSETPHGFKAWRCSALSVPKCVTWSFDLLRASS